MGIPKTSPSQSGFAPWPPSFGVGGWGRLRPAPGPVNQLREGAVGILVIGEEMKKAAAEAGFVLAHGDKLRDRRLDGVGRVVRVPGEGIVARADEEVGGDEAVGDG